MKLNRLFPILLLIGVASCQDSKLKVGDCIQKPDEPFIYKISAINECKATLQSLNGGKLNQTNLDDSMWTLTSCL